MDAEENLYRAPKSKPQTPEEESSTYMLHLRLALLYPALIPLALWGIERLTRWEFLWPPLIILGGGIIIDCIPYTIVAVFIYRRAHTTAKFKSALLTAPLFVAALSIPTVLIAVSSTGSLRNIETIIPAIFVATLVLGYIYLIPMFAIPKLIVKITEG